MKKAQTSTVAAMDGLADAIMAMRRALDAVEKIGGKDAERAADMLRLTSRITMRHIGWLTDQAGQPLDHEGCLLFVMSRVKVARRAAA